MVGLLWLLTRVIRVIRVIRVTSVIRFISNLFEPKKRYISRFRWIFKLLGLLRTEMRGFTIGAYRVQFQVKCGNTVMWNVWALYTRISIWGLSSWIYETVNEEHKVDVDTHNLNDHFHPNNPSIISLITLLNLILNLMSSYLWAIGNPERGQASAWIRLSLQRLHSNL